MNNNCTTLVGNLTSNPEARFTPSGANLCTFGLAINTRVKAADGTWGDGDAMFFDCKAWGDLATHITDSLEKGQRVIVFGELDYRAWKADDGSNRSKVEVKVEACGPDLRWATATVSRTERGSGSSGGASQSRPVPAEDPFA